MTQTIDPVKLKSAAEHLEWVLRQYPDSEDVQGLLHALTPLINDARAGKILAPVESIPCEYNFSDGIYRPYKNPSVEDAYVNFMVDMEGGLTDEDKKRIANTQAMIDMEKSRG